MKEEVQNYYTTIATKVSKSDKAKLCAIAKKFEMSFYELLQSLLLFIVRCFDTDTPISTERETMLNTFFDVMFSTIDSFSPLAIKGHQLQNIDSAILFVNRKNSKQPQVVKINRNEQGKLTENYNTDKMLYDYLQSTDPKLLKILKIEQKRKNLFSISETLHQVIAENRPKPTANISEEINSLFDDIRIPSGQKINDNIFYKGKHNRGDYTLITQRRKDYNISLANL